MRLKYLLMVFIISALTGCMSLEEDKDYKEIREKIAELRNGRDSHVYDAAFKLLNYGNKAIPFLTELLLDERAGSWARQLAVNVIVNMEAKTCKEDLIKAYHKYTGDMEIRTRQAIIEALGKLTEGREDIFYEAFHDPSLEVQAAAGLTLWERGEINKKFVQDLIDSLILKADFDWYGSGLASITRLLFKICDFPSEVGEMSPKELNKWWSENEKFYYISAGRLEMNYYAQKYGIPINGKTGRMIDPKDGHDLSELEELKLMKQLDDGK
ncbi:MAG: hypothetical protein V1709_05515 [Planctomycetota bacterium]